MDAGKSGLHILRFEWSVWLFFSLGVFFAASMLMTGWPAGLIPNIRYPYVYSEDGLFYLAQIQKLTEGAWVFINNRLGFPFGGNFLDFPVPDTGSLLILKVIGTLFRSPQAAMNLYFLIGFPVTFICSYVFLRIIGISRSFSVAAGLLFVFLPFHFQRIAHLFYTWYFVVPIFFYFGFWLFFSKPLYLLRREFRYRTTLSAVVLFVSAFFGVYYAFFGCLILFVSAVAGAIKNKSYRCLIVGFATLAIVSLGVLVNVAPNIQYKMVAGDNAEVAKRNPAETEIYGLKLVQMLLPHQGHRVGYLNNLAEQYNNNFPLVNENVTSALGVVGAAGFVFLLFAAFVLMCGLQVDSRLAFFSITTLFLFFFATIGGFSALFAITVSPMLRAWNRISIFIGFGAIASAFLILQISLKKFFSEIQAKKMMLPIAIGLCILGFWDQTSRPSVSHNDSIRVTFESDHLFINGIEALVPAKSAIYQLPYMAFPEVPPLNQLTDYGLFIGFLHSELLHWSYGGMKGREGDLFFRALAQQPLQKQVEVVTKLGFAGIYIDRRGFEDHGRGLEKQLQQILGAGPQLQSSDGKLVFFKILHPETPLKEGLSPQEIMEKADFFADKYGARYQATLAEGIDFRRSDLPIFVKEIKGLSDTELWGRWSDAKLSKSIEIKFIKSLPASFTLILRAQPFGPNSGAPVKIQVGDHVETVIFSVGMEEKRIRVVTKNPVYKIEIFPPFPKSPSSIVVSSDTRELGIGFERIWIEVN
jgi:hypothetical protein